MCPVNYLKLTKVLWRHERVPFSTCEAFPGTLSLFHHSPVEGGGQWSEHLKITHSRGFGTLMEFISWSIWVVRKIWRHWAKIGCFWDEISKNGAPDLDFNIFSISCPSIVIINPNQWSKSVLLGAKLGLKVDYKARIFTFYVFLAHNSSLCLTYLQSMYCTTTPTHTKYKHTDESQCWVIVPTSWAGQFPYLPLSIFFHIWPGVPTDSSHKSVWWNMVYFKFLRVCWCEYPTLTETVTINQKKFNCCNERKSTPRSAMECSNSIDLLGWRVSVWWIPESS